MYLLKEHPVGFYVYAYLRNDGTPYYVGKGKSNRAWRQHRTMCGGVHTPKDKKFIVILESNLTEIGAYALERRMINWYGRKDIGTGILHNRTHGGEGPSSGDRTGSKNPMFGKKNTVESNRIRSVKLTGRIFSNETLLKMSASKKGKNIGKENAMFGKHQSDLCKQRASETLSQKIQCLHCRTIVNLGNYKRWHGNNCKSNGP